MSPVRAPGAGRTLPPRVADRLRDAIFSGALRPGLPLLQEDLAARFGVSLVPVREALRQLEGEGLVRNIPYRGAIVSPLSAEEIVELRDMRIALESLALRLAVPKISSRALDQAEKTVRFRGRISDPVRWGDLTRRIYEVLYEPAGRPLLLSIVLFLHAQTARYFPLFIGAKRARDLITREALRLLDACRLDDPEEAIRTLGHLYAGAAARAVAQLSRAAPGGGRAPGREGGVAALRIRGAKAIPGSDRATGPVGPDSADDRRTQASHLSERIREAIFTGALRPGAPIRQQDMATRFGVSRMPVREALRHLEAEGFVVSTEYRGAIVAPLDAEEIREIRDIRIVLESQAMRIALPRMGAEDLRRCRDLVALQTRTNHPAQWCTLNRTYLSVMYAPARRPRLLSLILFMHAQALRYLPLLVSSRENTEAFRGHRAALVDSCERRDVEEAVRNLEVTYTTASRAVLDALVRGGAPGARRGPGRPRTKERR